MKKMDANLGIGRQLSRRRVAVVPVVLAMALCLLGLVAAPVFAAPVLLNHTQFPAAAPATGLTTIPGSPITYNAPAGNNRMLVVTLATDASSVSANPTNLADCPSLSFTVDGANPVAPLTSSPVARTAGYTTNYASTTVANRVGAHVFNIWMGDSATSQTVSFTNPLSRGQVWHLSTFGNMAAAAAKSLNGYANTATNTLALYTNAITTPINSECLVVVQSASARAVLNPASTGSETILPNTPTPQGSYGNYMYYLVGKGPELFSWYVQNDPAGTSVSYLTTASGTNMWASYGASYQTAYRVAATAGTGGTLSGWTNGDHDFDSAVSITAAADPGYHFVKWEMNDAAQGVADSWVDVSAVPNNLTAGTTCTFKAGRKVDQTTSLDRNGHVLRATFARNPSHTVTFSLNGGEGSVPPVTPASITVYEGDTYGTLPTVPDYLDHNFGGWYGDAAATGSQVTAATTVTIVADQTLYAKWIVPIILTATGVKVVTKTYDGNATATIDLSAASLVGVVGADDVTLVTPAPAGTFDSENADLNKPVTVTLSIQGADVAKYKLTQPTLTGEIQARILTVKDAVAQNKTYDRGMAAVITFPVDALQNTVSGDEVALVTPGAGTFADKLADDNKTVTADLELTGADHDNYVLTQPAPLTANIAAAPLTVTGAVAQNKTYDGSPAAVILGPFTLDAVILGDVVSVQAPGAGSFADKTAAPGKAVDADLVLIGDDAANYTLTQPTGLTANIATRELTVSGAVAKNKPYDGNNTAVIDVTTGPAVLENKVVGDVVSLVTPGSGTFNGKSAAPGKSVTALLELNLSGADAANYHLTQPTGLTADITPKPLTVLGAVAQNKPYDGNTDAVINVAGATLNGVVPPEIITLVPTGANTFAGTFADKNAAEGISVTGVGTWGLAGDTATDYTVTKPSDLTAKITTVPLTVAVIGSPTKAKNGNNATPALETGNFRVDGLVAGESFDITATSGTYASAEAGDWLITVPLLVNNFAPVGAESISNYALPSPLQATGMGTITLLALPEIVTWPSSATAITLGQPLSASTLSGQFSNTLGTFEFSPPTLAPPNAGDYSALVAFKPADPATYAVLTQSMIVRVNKATPNITLTATSITPGQELSASTLGGTAKNPYSQAAVLGVFAFDTPNATPAAGNYSAAVTFTPQVTANYNNAVGNVTVVVAALVLKVTAVGNNTTFVASPGDDVTLQVALADVTAPVKSYAWYEKTGGLDWTLMPNEDTAKLVLKAVTPDDAGQYKCEVTDSSMSVVSPVFTLGVNKGVPAVGLAGLAALAAVLGLGGAAKQRRRK